MVQSVEAVPAFNLTFQDIDNLLDELREYHAIYSPLFQRREQREWSIVLPLKNYHDREDFLDADSGMAQKPGKSV